MSRIFDADEINLHLIRILSGTVDPSAGAGVARAIASLYARAMVGAPGLWQKTGASDTDWDQLAQSLAWRSVLDYGADPTGTVDATAAFQQAITDQGSLGGGVVYVPHGTYMLTQVSMAGAIAVQLIGAGAGSLLKWAWNAGGGGGSMLTISADAQRCRCSNLRFDGSGLTGPSTDNHLLLIDATGGSVVETHVDTCWFGGMVVGSGDGVHIVGAAADLVSRLWVRDCEFNGCARYGLGHEQGWQFGWVINNTFTNNQTDLGFVATANVNSDAIHIAGNEIIHTGTERRAARFEGNSAGFYTRFEVMGNVILGGFATLSNTQYSKYDKNPIFSGAFASADPVLRVFGSCADSSISGNLIDRDPAASAGVCLGIESAGGSSPSRWQANGNTLVQEVAGAGFVSITDGDRFELAGNQCRHAGNAGATTAMAIDVAAVTVALDNALITGNQMTAVAGTFAAAVRLLANGANVNMVSIVSNQANEIDVGARFEIGGGGGNFAANQILFSGNNTPAATADWANVGGAAVVPRVGFNAGLTGSQLFEGDGSPEGVVTARISSMYLNRLGGQGTSVYYKETGIGNTGWVALGGSPIVFGGGDMTAVATAVYMGPGFLPTPTATEIKMPVTRPGTMRALRVNITGAGTGAATVTYTARKNGVDTALSASLGNTATGLASNTADNFTVVAGDLVSVSCVKSGAVAAGQTNVVGSWELV